MFQIALGVIGKGCYLQETWNKLDCFIVVSGYVSTSLYISMRSFKLQNILISHSSLFISNMIDIS